MIDLKTRYPLILTAQIAEHDIAPFNDLRQQHFPPERNVLKAHITMFHRLPGEYRDRIVRELTRVGGETPGFTAEARRLRHLGAGVALEIGSSELEAMRARLRVAFAPWLGPQDMQVWRPHITIQNNVDRQTADRLYRELQASYQPLPVRITGLDLWDYLGGPWQHAATVHLAG